MTASQDELDIGPPQRIPLIPISEVTLSERWTFWIDRICRDHGVIPLGPAIASCLHGGLTTSQAHFAERFAPLLIRGGSIALDQRAGSLDLTRSAAEFEACRRFKAPITKAIERGDLVKLAALIEDIHQACSPDRPRGFRTTEIATSGDRGRGFLYAEPGAVPRLMTETLETTITRARLNVVEAAILLYFGTLNIHPFSDGNGRTARVLLNAVLPFGSDFYLPVREINFFSGGAFVHYIRMAEFQGQWAPLVVLVGQSIQCWLDALSAWDANPCPH